MTFKALFPYKITGHLLFIYLLSVWIKEQVALMEVVVVCSAPPVVLESLR